MAGEGRLIPPFSAFFNSQIFAATTSRCQKGGRKTKQQSEGDAPNTPVIQIHIAGNING
jgi:hypothetical protein